MRTPFGVVGAYILFQVALYKSLDFGEIVSVLTVAGLVLGTRYTMAGASSKTMEVRTRAMSLC
jgi:hypothetical protein